MHIILVGEQLLHVGKYRIGAALLQAEHVGIVVRLTDEIVHSLYPAFPRGFGFRRQHVVAGQRYAESSGADLYRTNPGSGTILSHASHAHRIFSIGHKVCQCDPGFTCPQGLGSGSGGVLHFIAGGSRHSHPTELQSVGIGRHGHQVRHIAGRFPVIGARDRCQRHGSGRHIYP